MTSSRTLVKSYKRLKEQNLPEDVLEKSWSEKFHKIHPKEMLSDVKSFFS